MFKIIKNSLLIFFIYFFSIISFDCKTNLFASSQKDLEEFFSNLDTVSVDIVRQKYVNKLSRTFNSYSSAKIEKDKGLYWRERNNIFISTKEKYCYNGKETKFKDLPHFSDIKKMIDSCIKGDTSALKKIFDIEYKDDIILKPNISEIKKHISEIKINLDKNTIKYIELNYTNKNRMKFLFKPAKEPLNYEIKC